MKHAFIGCCAWLAVAAALPAQTRINLSRQSKAVDFSAADTTKPFKTGAALPAVCSTGETFFHTGVPAGKNLYACVAQNTWAAAGPANEVPSPAGMAGRVLASDGSQQAWTEPAGDISGPVANMTVNRIQNRDVSPAAPSAGEVLSWNEALGEWEPAPSAAPYVPGDGIALVGYTISVDSAVVPQYLIGSGVPAMPCSAGRDIYTDTAGGDLYFCATENTWQAVAKPGHTHGASDIVSGSLPLERGGTSQTSWTPGRCVQVRADGLALESAAAPCGSGGGGLTLTDYIWLFAATRSVSSSAPAMLSYDATDAPASPALAGPIPSIPFADAVTDAVHFHYALPDNWQSGAGIDLKIYIATQTSSTGQNTYWTLQTACVAVGENQIAPAYSAAQALAVPGAAAAMLQTAAFVSIPVAGCAPGELMFFKLARTAGNALDTADADVAELRGVQLKLVRSLN